MKRTINLQFSTAIILFGIVLLLSCNSRPSPNAPLTLSAQLSPDPTNYGTCDAHISTMQVTVVGPASEIARIASMNGELYWLNPDGSPTPGVVSGVAPILTRQANGTYSATYDWSSGTGLTTPLSLNFIATAYDSSGAILAQSNLFTVSFLPCQGGVSLPSIHFPVTLVAPSTLTMVAELLPEPVYYQAGCDPHVSNVRVTLSGIFASTVSSFDSGLAWTLPDGSFPPGVNGVPLSLTLQSDGSYTGSYDWGVHPPGLSGPYILNFSATALDSSGNALNKQVVTANFLPCPGLSGPSFPYHLTNFEFDCLSLKSSVMIFTFDQSISGNYQGKMGNQTWQCLLDQNNNHRLICTGAGVTQDIKAQVSLSDLQNPQITLTQDTTTPTCVIATPSNAACTIAEENACTSIKKTIDPLTCTCK